MNGQRIQWCWWFAALFGVLLPSAASAADLCDAPVGRMISVQGNVELLRSGAAEWQHSRGEDLLCPGDAVRAGERSRAAVSFFNDGTVLVDENTSLRLLGTTTRERSLLDVLLGTVDFFSRRPQTLDVSTPYVNAGVEGTEFLVRVLAERAEILVFEGTVRAANDRGSVRLTDGEAATAAAGAAPMKTIIARPRDAVQWALYYPPVLAALADRSGKTSADLAPALAEAVRLGGTGDLAGAFAALDRVPPAERGAQFHLVRAALLLNVGSADEAGADIEQTLALDPTAGEALALRAIIAVVGNQRQQAIADGEQGVALSPRSAAAKVALSYALEADGQLERSRDVLLQAVAEQPADSLAWARLAEVWLALGYRRRAVAAAETAVELAPQLERAQTVLGFAALARFDTEAAGLAFRRAMALDPANPLPRLGAGLADIRDGHLEEGRQQLEIAAGLDPNNALVRSYLGKAYYEERRDDRAGREFEVAKGLDPNDPTPYFYDAIRKQTENRPVEALRDLQRSIALNDNRAVYRGRLLLDQDRGARSASIGRIFDDLGFEQAGVNAATRSLAFAPDSAAAHRFLSDVYAARPRHEIARVSELLQAQLLQDLNINPIQPSLTQTDLRIVARGGPAVPGFNEFNPLFERNEVQFNAAGAAGNFDTFAGETVVSAIYDQVSLSGGFYHFQTDGFRANNDNRHEIGDLFAQVALTPELNLQAEFRKRSTEQGDLALNFDPDTFSPVNRGTLETTTARFGARYSPAPHSDFVLSYIYSEFDETRNKLDPIEGFDDLKLESNATAGIDGHQFEGQYLFRQSWFNLTAGGGILRNTRSDFLETRFVTAPFETSTDPFEPDVDTTVDQDVNNLYVYANVEYPRNLTWTVGFSYDDYEEGLVSANRVNPKVGVQWDIADDLRLRFAYFTTVKRPLAADQTIEPTQVAGFNQFFDDFDGSKTQRLGVGLDVRPLPDVLVGVEASWRDVEVPLEKAEAPKSIVIDQRDEELYRGYLYWMPLDQIAISAEVAYEQFKRKTPAGVNITDLPGKIDTLSVPVTIRYFHPSGFFAEARATFVNQEVDLPKGTAFAQEEAFVVVDAAVGYRLPKRLGVASLECRNLFDESFFYQDTNFQTSQPQNPRFIPAFAVLGQLTLNF
jgi:tetratricopeptide (TPR) repeat protein